MRLSSIDATVKSPKNPPNESGSFSFDEGKRTDIYKLDEANPEDIYSHNFISRVSLSLFRGKIVIINCGEFTGERKTIDQFHPLQLPKNPSKVEFIVSELIYGEQAERIRRMDDKDPDKRREIEPSIRYETFNDGLFGFVKQFIGFEPPPFLFVELKEKGSEMREEEEISFNKPPNFLDYVPIIQQKDDYDYSLIGNNKYLNAPSLIIERPINFYLKQLDKMLEKDSIVQIRRVKTHEIVEKLGMFVEKDPDTGEIILNFNGQNEFHFVELFIPLALYYLEKKSSVLIDCDVELYLEDIKGIEERISQGDTYEQIYKGILTKTKAKIYVERRVTNPSIDEEHNFIVMSPKQI